MAIEIGKRVSRELREYIETFTTPDERKDLYMEMNVPASTLRDSINGSTTLTERTYPYVIELVKLSMKNRSEKLRGLLKTHKQLAKSYE